jgi:hypothetical protein
MKACFYVTRGSRETSSFDVTSELFEVMLEHFVLQIDTSLHSKYVP